MSTLIDFTEGRLNEAVHLSRKLADRSLINCLRGLKIRDENHNTKTIITNDGGPYSFYFERFEMNEASEPIRDKEHFRGNGGIIFHGKPGEYIKNNAVQLNPTTGWSIHT